VCVSPDHRTPCEGPVRKHESSDKGIVASVPADLAPPDYRDPIVEAFKKDVDRTLLRENLKLTPEERFRKCEQLMRSVLELRGAARARPGG
jgi:hypothetical protein